MNYFRCGGGRSTHTASQLTVAKTPLATFESNVSGLYIPEILAYIQATQSGTGDPSPSNPRSIVGFNSVTVGTVNNTANAEYFDGLLKGTHVAVELSFYNWTENASYDNVFNTPTISATYTTYDRESLISDMYPVYTSSDVMNHDYGIAIAASRRQFYVKNKDYSTAADFKTAMTGHYMIFKLATPITPTITKAEYEAVCAAFGYTGTTATTALGGTYYGGYVNVTTGLLTVTHRYYEFDGSNDEDWRNTAAGLKGYRSNTIALTSEISQASDVAIIANEFLGVPFDLRSFNVVNLAWHNTNANNLTVVSSGDYDSSTKFKEFLTNNPLQVVIGITPQTVQLTPAQLEQLLGQNNVFCSSGDVAVKYWKID